MEEALGSPVRRTAATTQLQDASSMALQTPPNLEKTLAASLMQIKEAKDRSSLAETFCSPIPNSAFLQHYYH